MYDKVLMPSDGSEGSEVALDHAIEIAEKFDAELHILYVVDTRISSTQEAMVGMMNHLKSIGENSTERIAEEARKRGVTTVKDIVEGVPHKEINNYVGENSIDMITMSTHGRTGLDRILIGSTTEKIIRTADIPVMTVKRNE